MHNLITYKYYDTPEGQDIFLKTFSLSKYAALAGLGAATFDVLMFSHPKGLASTAGRYLWYIGPLVGMASAYTVTTNVMQNIRGKNDTINYFLGGVCAGAVFGTWSKSPAAAVPISLLLGIVGALKKTSVDEGWLFFPDFPQMTKTIQSVRHDWTMAEDIEELKNYTIGPPK